MDTVPSSTPIVSIDMAIRVPKAKQNTVKRWKGVPIMIEVFASWVSRAHLVTSYPKFVLITREDFVHLAQIASYTT